MCIALVKPKGIYLPEEHLENGWAINNDGAGFACIDYDGDFVIHRSMTYEGFIGVYRKAIALYGDTSDFLIHFRITSKGATDLANCHPFVVDKDRVIIHNGTLYNISIDEDDTRSDTKVFASDWLSQLPEDWEDNAVFKLMLEDFISSSRIAMLHRTKGVFIFNAEKGVYDKGIWYSNTGYKTITSPTIYYSQWTKYNKFNSALKNNEDSLSLRWVPCACCGEYDTTMNMLNMHADHIGQMWCYDCYAKSVTCDCCNKRCAEDSADEYLNPLGNDTLIVCNTCAADPDLMDSCIKRDKEEETLEEDDAQVA